MRHANTESYILSKGRVESALGNVGVESRGTDTVIGFCAARDEAGFLQVPLVGVVLPLEALYDMLLSLLVELADTGTDIGTDTLLSKSNLSKLSVCSKENLLK